MSRPRFLIDHDFNEKIVAGVRRRQPTAEFRLARELALHASDDAAILEYADSSGMIVVSHDVNTMTAAAVARLKGGRNFAGLFLVAQSMPIPECIDDLVLIWESSDAEEWRNLITFLPL